jgi:dihydrofolate reductase
MRKLIYSMTTSLDGFIAGPDGELDWSVPDEELFRFHTERVSKLGVQLCGRRLYETMLVWETFDQRESATELELEFARIWKALPKIVFSRTLRSVEGNARLAREGLVEEVSRLKAQPGKDLAVGGAGLASGLARLGLIDEYQIFVSPVALGVGKPFLENVQEQIDLELLETRTFASRVVYIRYGTRLATADVPRT